MLTLDEEAGLLRDAATGRRFDVVRRVWEPGRPAPGSPVTEIAAATWVQRRSGHRVRQPVGVIGPRETGAAQLAAAEAVGRGLAAIGLTVVCGGRQGVMEAVCRGVASGGGVSIGLLPEADASLANGFVTIPLATGIGEARNALVARSSFCLVAIGDSYGTLSEVALGLQFGKPVIGLEGAARVAGVHHLASAEAAITAVARLVLALPIGEPEVPGATVQPT
jgi:uncharacterized protein (TIGR00725 family)